MKDPRNVLEWIVFAFGLLLVISIAVYLIQQCVEHEDSAPILTVRYSVEEDEGLSRYFITVRNEGFTTAADVLVKISPKHDTNPLHEGELHFPFVPRKSERSGWYQFPPDFNPGTVAIDVVSYRKP